MNAPMIVSKNLQTEKHSIHSLAMSEWERESVCVCVCVCLCVCVCMCVSKQNIACTKCDTEENEHPLESKQRIPINEQKE